MSDSISKLIQLNCRNCGVSFEANIDLVVNPAEKPDLLEQLDRGTLQQVTCPRCGFRGVVDTPLLIFRPHDSQPFVLSPSTNSPPENWNEHARFVFRLLRDQLQERWKPEWENASVAVENRKTLSARLREDAAIRETLPKIVDLINSGVRLIRQYQSTSDLKDLESAVKVWETLLNDSELTGFPEWTRFRIFEGAAVTFVWRFRHNQNKTDLERGIRYSEQVIALTPKYLWQRPRYLQNLATALRDRYKLLNQTADLDKAIELLIEAANLIYLDPDSFSSIVHDLCVCMLKRYELTHSVEDLDYIILVLERLLMQAPGDSIENLNLLLDLSDVRHKKYDHTRALEDLAETINVYERTLLHSLLVTPKREIIFNNLGRAHKNRFRHTRDIGDLDKSLELYSQISENSSLEPEFVALVHNNLGETFRARYELQGDPSDLVRASEHFFKSLEKVQPNSPESAIYSNDVATTFYLSYRRNASRLDLDQAIAFLDRAWSHPGLTPRQRAPIAQNRGVVQMEFYSATKEPKWLSFAQESFEYAAAEASSLEGKADASAALSVLFKDRYLREYNKEFLESAIRFAEEACAIYAPDSHQSTIALNSLADVRKELFNRTGEKLQLDQAIAALRRAVAQERPPSPTYFRVSSNLGDTLRRHYRQSGDLGDLQEAIEIHTSLVRLEPSDPTLRATVLLSLGVDRLTMYQHTTHEFTDLLPAIACFEQALAAAPTSDLKAIILDHLGDALILRYSDTSDVSYFDAALDAYEKAAGETTDVGLKISYLNNKGNALRQRFRTENDPTFLQEAIDCYLEGLALYSSKSEVDAGLLGSAANGLADRFLLFGNQQDYAQAISFYEEAYHKLKHVSLVSLFQVTKGWTTLALYKQDWNRAKYAVEAAQTAVSQLLHAQALRLHKEAWLKQAQWVPTYSAYVLARTGDLRGAVVALENGRAELMQETIQTRSERFQELEKAHPELYQEYHTVIEQLAQVQGAGDEKLWSLRNVDFAKFRELQARFERVNESLRSLPEMDSLFTPISLEEIREILTSRSGKNHSVAVYLVMTSIGSLALILYQRDIRSVWFDWTSDELSKYLLPQTKEFERAGFVQGQLGRVRLVPEMDKLLPAVGAGLIQPLMGALKEIVQNELNVDQLILIPTGLLTLVPLHAAPISDGTESEILLARFNIKYAPSARALRHLRECFINR